MSDDNSDDPVAVQQAEDPEYQDAPMPVEDLPLDPALFSKPEAERAPASRPSAAAEGATPSGGSAAGEAATQGAAAADTKP